jgi:hypothetical protein
MIALGTAWNPALNAESLFAAAQQLKQTDPEIAEELEGFAHDFAVVHSLPVYDGWVRGESNQ